MKKRCVIVGGADIARPDLVRGYLKPDDYVIYCDSGLRHMDVLEAPPDLIVGDFDSHEDPHMDVETIVLPVAKDDTDTAFAAKEGIRRGFTDFLLLGAIGARFDHTLVNAYILTSLEDRGCHGMIVDDYSEMELICGRTSNGREYKERMGIVAGRFPFFSLVALEGSVQGVTIRNAKFPLEGAEIGPDYQYATSNEVLPGMTAEIELQEGRLLLIRVF